jgi:hypothetical protein
MSNSCTSSCIPVKLTILNPLVVLADTVDVILPSVFDTPVPFANQFHETIEFGDIFTTSEAFELLPNV